MRRPPFAPYHAGAPRFQVALAPIDPDTWLLPDHETRILPWRRNLLARPETCYRVDRTRSAVETEAAALVLAGVSEPIPPQPTLLDACAHVSDDLVVLHREDSGDWRVSAIVLTSPTFFSVDHAFGGGLAALHGPVPDGSRLAQRIGRVFDNLREEMVLERFNWTLQAGDERFTPDATALRQRAREASLEEAESLLHLRVERQTIRRLPQTGGVLFTIRVSIDPVSAIEETDRMALAQAWRGIGAPGFAYKGWGAVDRLAQELFRRWGV